MDKEPVSCKLLYRNVALALHHRYRMERYIYIYISDGRYRVRAIRPYLVRAIPTTRMRNIKSSNVFFNVFFIRWSDYTALVPAADASTDEFRYLGSLISRDLTDNSDVQQRIGLASKEFGSLRKEFFCKQSLNEVT